MPMYDYRCECGSELEQLDRIDAPMPSCPSCGSSMARLVSPAVVRGQGIRPEVAPAQASGPGARPDSKPKRSGRETIERVAQRMLAESRKPGATPLTPEQAVAKATRTRLRKERDGRG